MQAIAVIADFQALLETRLQTVVIPTFNRILFLPYQNYIYPTRIDRAVASMVTQSSEHSWCPLASQLRMMACRSRMVTLSSVL